MTPKSSFFAFIFFLAIASQSAIAKASPDMPSNLRQFKSDATSTIPEDGVTTEASVVFGAVINSQSPVANPLILQIEASTSTDPANRFANPLAAESAPVSPGAFAAATLRNIGDGSYHWRAKTLDAVTRATSDWQEFGAAGNTDFEVYLEAAVRVPNQTVDDSVSHWSWYSDNWYGLGAGFYGTLRELDLEGYVDGDMTGYASRLYLKEFSDPGYTELNKTYTLSDNAPFTMASPLGQYKIILGTTAPYQNDFYRIIETFKFLKRS